MFDKKAQKALQGVVVDRKRLDVSMVTRTQFLSSPDERAYVNSTQLEKEGGKKVISVFFCTVILLFCVSGNTCGIFVFFFLRIKVQKKDFFFYFFFRKILLRIL